MDETEVLLEEAPHRLPERIVAEAELATGGPAALYAVDLAGSVMRQIAGSAGLPAEIAVSEALGPELDRGAVAALVEAVTAAHRGATVAPLSVRGRATCVLVAAQGPAETLEALAAAAASAGELA